MSMPLDISARLAAIEQSVAKLQQQTAAQGEQTIATYLSVDPATGAVTANFSGAFVGNLILPEAPAGSFTTVNAVSWRDTGGTIREHAQGWTGGAGDHHLDVRAFPDTGAHGPDLAAVQLSANAAGAAGSSNVVVHTQDGFTAADNFNVTALDSLGRSGYAQVFGTLARFVIDSNNGSLYDANFTNIPAGGSLTTSFATVRSSWTTPALWGMLSTAATVALTAQYAFTAPNSFAITVFNSSGAMQSCDWIGVVAGI